ncbi:MAG: prepilin-type N-terminal cleavage/methylation domain-containing protein [Pseudomonadota bacterium]
MFRQNLHGFSLVEVMITLFIVGVGMLGLGLAQISAVNANQEANFRLQATNLASSLTQRFKLNETYFNDKSIATNIYSLEKGNMYSQYCKSESDDLTINLGAIPTSCIDNMCTPEEIARFDVHDICQTEFSAINFPNGELGVICHDVKNTDSDDCSPGSILSIYVGWQSKTARKDTGENIMGADPTCSLDMWGTTSQSQGKQCIKVDVAI